MHLRNTYRRNACHCQWLNILNVGRATAVPTQTASGLHPVRHISMWFLRCQCPCQPETGGDEGQDGQKQARERQVCLVRFLPR